MGLIESDLASVILNLAILNSDPNSTNLKTTEYQFFAWIRTKLAYFFINLPGGSFDDDHALKD